MQVNKTLREWSKGKPVRLVRMAIQTEQKGEAELEGCVLLEDLPRVMELFREVMALTAKAESLCER